MIDSKGELVLGDLHLGVRTLDVAGEVVGVVGEKVPRGLLEAGREPLRGALFRRGFILKHGGQER